VSRSAVDAAFCVMRDFLSRTLARHAGLAYILSTNGGAAELEKPMATLYRAHRNPDMLAAAAEGWCLTDDADAARRYGPHIAVVEIDLDALTVAEVDGYDRATNTTPADSAAFRAAQGADVLGYDDENERGEYHYTWRLASAVAVAAARIVRVYDVRDED